MKVKQLLKTFGILITIVILLSIGIGLTLLWRNSRRDKGTSYTTAFGSLPYPVQVDPTQNIDFTISYEADDSSISMTNKVYGIDTSNDFYPSKTLAKSVANKLKLEPANDEDKKVFLYDAENSDVSLTYDDGLKLITIKLSSGESSIQPDIPTEKELAMVAKDKLEEFGLWPFEEGYITDYRYYYTIVYSYYETKLRDKASLIGVTFTSKVNGVPVVSSRVSSGEIEVLMDTNKQVIKISYAYRPQNEEISATYPLKTTSQALASFESGGGEFISSMDKEYPTSITLDTVIIAYKIEYKEQEYLQPVYVFEGTDNNGEIVTAIVPAIEELYLINPSE